MSDTKKIPEIKMTDDYDLFKKYGCNRPVSEQRVLEMVIDPTFPEKFPTCPIIVNKEYRIIDGQHRFTAAQKIPCPVYYIMDPEANVEDIRIRNIQMAPWTLSDYVHFHADTKPEYKRLLEYRNKYKVPYTSLNSVINRLTLNSRVKFNISLKKGTFTFAGTEDMVKEFMDEFTESIVDIRNAKGALEASFLTMEMQIGELAVIFQENKKKFQKIMKNCVICSIPFIDSRRKDIVRSNFERIYLWKNKRVNEAILDELKSLNKVHSQPEMTLFQ